MTQGGKKILVIEDGATPGAFHRMMLGSEAECDVILAANTSRDLDVLREDDAIDLVVLDVNALENGGIEILEEKMRGRARRTPVLVAAFRKSEEETPSAVGFGAGAYFIQPWTASQLKALVESL